MRAYEFAAWEPSDGEGPVGLVLDPAQASLIADIEHDGLVPPADEVLRGVQRQAMRSMLERGLVYRGPCPRCRDWMSWSVPFGVSVDEKALRTMIVRQELASASSLGARTGKVAAEDRDAGTDPSNPTVTFVCACGTGHSGRPDDAVFIGCGAAWNQPMRSDGSGVRSATPAEAEWAAHIKQDLATPPLARIRATANQWRNGVTALTTLLTSVSLISATIDVTKLRFENKVVVISLSAAGFVVLLIGTFTALSASIGVGGYDHRLLSMHGLRRYERRRGREAIRQIELTKWLVVVGVALIALGGFWAVANPAL